MSVQLLEGLPLLAGGAVALHADCCCTPPCLPCEPTCNTCYDTTELACNTFESYTVEITGIANPTYTFSPMSGCGTTDCDCDDANAVYAMSGTILCGTEIYRNLKTCGPQSQYQQFPPLGAITCVGTILQEFIITVDVIYNNKERTVAAGAMNDELILFNDRVLVGATIHDSVYICQNYTIPKGHVFLITVIQGVGPSIAFFNHPDRLTIPQGNKRFYYIYAPGNAVKTDAACPDEETLGSCSGLAGGTADLVAVHSPQCDAASPTFCYLNCDSYPNACDIDGITITIGNITIADTPPPPP